MDDERVEPGILARICFDWVRCERATKRGECRVDAGDLVPQFGRDVLEPCADDGRGGRLLRLRLGVVACLPLDRAAGGLDIGVARGLGLGQSLFAAAPRFRERRRATQETLAKNLHRECAGTSSSSLARGDQTPDRLAECVERAR